MYKIRFENRLCLVEAFEHRDDSIGRARNVAFHLLDNTVRMCVRVRAHAISH